MSTELDEELTTAVQTIVTQPTQADSQTPQTAAPVTPAPAQIGPTEDEVALGDKRVELSTFDRYKGAKGRTDRIGCISTTLLKAYNHFYQGKNEKKTFRCLSTPQKRALCCETLGEPSQKFGMVLFQYNVDQNGALIDPNKCQGKVLIWVISEARYQELTGVNSKWPLMDSGFTAPQHDLSIKCTEEQYQRMTMTPEPKAHWKSKQAWYNALKAKEVKAKEALKKALGWKLTESDVADLLGSSQGVSPGALANAGDVDLSDIVDEVS